MRKTMMVLLSLLSLLFVLTSVALAQDTQPPGDPADNVCNEGGMWDDGRCTVPQHTGSTELAWECGWYMARILDGRLPVSAMPSQCVHVLTAIQKAQVEDVVWPLCVLIVPDEVGKAVAKSIEILLCLHEDGMISLDSQNNGDVESVITFQSHGSNDNDCPSSVTYLGNTYSFPYFGETSNLFFPNEIDTSGFLPYFCQFSASWLLAE